MSDTRDTLFRYLAMLQLIPRSPGRISTPVLLEKLHERGFQVDARSLQRDLRDRLSLHFPLICDDAEKPFRWYFDKEFHCDLPALDTSSALTLVLAEEYLKGLLPPVVVGQLTPQFRKARQLLDGLGGNSLSQWAQRVRAIPNGKALIPAPLDETIWQAVAQGLLEQVPLKVTYLSRSAGEEKRFMLHPQGMVSRHSVTYLLATVNDYTDIRQFAVHRIRKATLNRDTPWRASGAFNLDDYIRGGAFGYRQSPADVELRARVSPHVAWLLSETPIAASQSLTPRDDSDWSTLAARVPDDQETLWWLQGMGAGIEVLAPLHWREHLTDSARRVLRLYEQSETHPPDRLSD